jgi:hypothetical protein
MPPLPLVTPAAVDSRAAGQAGVQCPGLWCGHRYLADNRQVRLVPPRGPSYLSLARRSATCRSASCARCSSLAASIKAPTHRALPAMRWLSDWGRDQERFVPLRGPSCLSLAWPRARLERARTAKLARRAEGRMPGVKISNQQRRPPHLALAGHSAIAPALLYLRHPCRRPARQVREPEPGFSTGLRQLLLRCSTSDIPVLACPGEKESTSMSTPATRPVVPTSPPHRGPG